jgi:hypothetical protein
MDDIVVDYAQPLLNVRKLLNNLQYFMHKNNYTEAVDTATKIIGEARILQHSIVVMQEKAKR